MRVLAELILIVALIAAGWNQPYKEYFTRVFPTLISKDSDEVAKNTGEKTQANSASTPAIPRVHATPEWMGKPTSLDAPTRVK